MTGKADQKKETSTSSEETLPRPFKGAKKPASVDAEDNNDLVPLIVLAVHDHHLNQIKFRCVHDVDQHLLAGDAAHDPAKLTKVQPQFRCFLSHPILERVPAVGCQEMDWSVDAESK